jgi:hypothetical protein
MSRPKFRHPSEISGWGGKRKMIGVRAKVETVKALEKAAKTYGLTLSELTNTILDDYVAWLASEEKNNNLKTR